MTTPNRFKTALEIQDACNLRAVVHTLHEIVREFPPGALVTKDAAVILIIDKLHDLVGRPEGFDYSRVYEECRVASQDL
jgi:hypothetical protein